MSQSTVTPEIHSTPPSAFFPQGIPIRRAPIRKNEKKNSGCEWFWGVSPQMQEVKAQIESTDNHGLHILIVGETGTGKEVVAKKLHQNRKQGMYLSDAESPFVAVNSGAVPEALAESILFGHERGAFTSARERQYGKFEMAKKGTLFLDEVQCLSLSTQVKLLRVLQNKEFERLGSRNLQSIECLIIAASNIPLELLVKRQLFRKDLYYRLNICPIYLPALRQRKEDLPHLIKGILEKLRNSHGVIAEDLSSEAFELMLAYAWPGNIRELEHALLFAGIRAGQVITVEDLPGTLTGKLAHYLNEGSWDLSLTELASR